MTWVHSQVSVVHGDCNALEIGQHVPWDGANLLVMDLFDESEHNRARFLAFALIQLFGNQ